MARVGEEGRAVTAVHAHQELRHRTLGPGHDSQGFGNRCAHPVGIPRNGADARRGNLVSPDVERERGDRKAQLPLHDLGRAANRHPLAAQLSVDVDDERFEDIDLRMGFEECPGVLNGIGHAGTVSVPCGGVEIGRRPGRACRPSRMRFFGSALIRGDFSRPTASRHGLVAAYMTDGPGSPTVQLQSLFVTVRLAVPKLGVLTVGDRRIFRRDARCAKRRQAFDHRVSRQVVKVGDRLPPGRLRGDPPAG